MTAMARKWDETYWDEILKPYHQFCIEKLFDYFVDVLIANAVALQEAGFDGAVDAVGTLNALRGSLSELDRSEEDLYLAILHQLEKRCDRRTAGVVRLGLSRNDVDMTVYRAYIRDRACVVLGALNDIRKSLLSLARENRATFIVAYTHHQPAQPTTLGHYLAAVECLLARDFRRLWEAVKNVNRCPLGASALAGTPYGVDRNLLAELLGFNEPVDQTYDAIASGDWALELSCALGVLGSSLSRFVWDLIRCAEKGALKIPDDLTQGSSIMIQKNNPVVLEHCRAFAAELLGGIGAISVLNFNIPFGDVNDHTVHVLGPLEAQITYGQRVLKLLNVVLSKSTFAKDILTKEFENKNVLASELVDCLVLTGHCDLLEAQLKAKQLLEALEQKGKALPQAHLEDLVQSLGVEDRKFLEALKLEAFAARRNVLGGLSSKAQSEHLRRAESRLLEDMGKLNRLLGRIQVAQERLRQSLDDEEL